MRQVGWGEVGRVWSLCDTSCGIRAVPGPMGVISHPGLSGDTPSSKPFHAGISFHVPATSTEAGSCSTERPGSSPGHALLMFF